jgi:hypothetical protein
MRRWGSVWRRENSPVRYQIALLLAALLVLGGANALAQQMPSPLQESGAGDLPPDMDLTESLPGGGLEEGVVPDGETIEPMAESLEGEHGGSFGAYGGDPMHLQHSYPSLFESSGTWLRRGFWYAEADYLLVNKAWDRKGMLFAYEGGPNTGGIGVAPGLNQFGQQAFGPVFAMNQLLIDGSKPGADGMARVSLGRFMFRDASNRDHNLQVTFLGGGVWKQDSSVQAATNEGLTVNDFIDRVNPSFDGAESMGFDYETGFDSIESNYVVKARMGKDQMVLKPDGHWVRSAQTSQTYSFLAGFRYANLTEVLNITAESNPDVATSGGGFYNVNTDNNLAGGQIGAGISQETSRWSLGMTFKGGSYWNRMNLNSEFRAGPDLIASRGTTDSTEDNLSFIGEFEVLGKWHLRPNLSIRAGFQVLYVDSIALAPSQVNFVPGGYGPIADDGDITCLGSSIGIEAYR